jgi:hypothetical protein
VHVLFSGLGLGLAVVAASALHSENPHVMQCDAFSNTARPLCLADYAACNLRSAIVFDKSNLSGTLIIAVAVACGVNVLAALVSPNLGLSQAMTQVRPSRPDTMIFRPAKYAPDGLTDAEAGDLCAKSRNDILIKLEAPEEREGVVMVESARSRSSVSARRLRSPRGVPHKALQAARFLASLKTGGFSNHHQGQAMVYHVETVPVPRTPSLPPVIERQILSIASRVQAAVPGASVTLASAEVPH